MRMFILPFLFWIANSHANSSASSIANSHAVGIAASIGIMAMEHARETKLRPDGNFDVICIDGEMEVRTPQEINRGAVCIHIRNAEQEWHMTEGGVIEGMRFCDLRVKQTLTEALILKLEVAFKEPCHGSAGTTQDCNGKVCSVRIDEKFYSADFSEANLLTLTRLSDGFWAKFIVWEVHGRSRLLARKLRH